MTTPEYNSPSWPEIFRYLNKNRLPILGISFIVAVIVAIITLFIPNRYTSTANLLPSQRPSLGFDLFSDEGGLSSIASSVLGGGASEEANRYIVLLSSYTTSKKVVEKFNLIKEYDLLESEAPMKYAIDILSERTTFESKEEGNFVIAVEDEDPQMAKEIAEFYIMVLNEINTRIVTQDARQYREFIEKRYQKALADADSLKQKLIRFQNKYGVIELPEQVKTYFGIIGGLTARQIESEIKLKLLSETVNQNSDSYKNAQIEYNSITRALNEAYSDSNKLNILLDFDKLPYVSATYYELTLQAEIQAEIQKFLLPVYEQAKMEEAKSLPIVSVVDSPIVPELKSYPKRSLIVIASGASAFILVALYFILQFSYKNNREYFSYLKG
ncbi:GumC family protein [Gracilimonas sp.]|uniref:GumC family protein n=1 Tax=Gracilimonas sp. TaxID=1974203 RepID=UPI003D0E201D